ncbi:MAG: RNA ligase (ATP) [Elusimicrobiota bacterium]
MERKLASVQLIKAVSPIEGADLIELVSVLGWQCVAKKGEYKPGDLAVYVEIDSLLPVKPEFEFLRKNCYRKMPDSAEGFRIKTIRLRGMLSQGILFPLSIIPAGAALAGGYSIGTEVTAALGVVKYEIPVPAQLAGKVIGQFPAFLRKTDEVRLQTYPEVIGEFKGKEVYISVKCDGSSMTVYRHDGKFGVCGRNYEYAEDSGNSLWQVARRYGLEEKLARSPVDYAIQGEICGPGIQKNPMRLPAPDLFVFDIFDIAAGRRLDHEERLKLAGELGLKSVPLEGCGIFDYTIEQLLEMAKGKYSGTPSHREGIVIRPVKEACSAVLQGRLSIKVINNDYLLSGGE